MRQGLYLFLGFVFLLSSCQLNGDLDIINPPAYLFCGAKYQFLVTSSRLPLYPLFWDARYGSIDSQGLYQAPDFPCQEVVRVTSRYLRREVTFPVVANQSDPEVSEVFPSLPFFEVLADPPSWVRSKYLPFTFRVRGGFRVVLNGVAVQKGFCEKTREISLSLTLEEGENELYVFLGDREVFRKHVVCDTTPPTISLSRAVATSEGIRVFGVANEEVRLGVAESFSQNWEVLVPWQGERRVLLQDRAGNIREEVFSVARDVSFEVTGPSRVKVGQEASFFVRCRYRDVSLEGGKVKCGDVQVSLEKGEGTLALAFSQEGEFTLTLSLEGVKALSVPLEVYAPPVALLFVTSCIPEEVVAGFPFVVLGMLQDADGDPSPGRKVWGEVRSSSSAVQLETVSDALGKWALTFENLSGFGKRTLRLSSEGKEWQREFYLILGQPVSLSRGQPGPVLRPVAGSREHSFTVRVVDALGAPVCGTKVEWVWKSEGEVFPVPPEDLLVHERTNSSGECSGTIVMPRKVGTYTLEARLPFWDVPPISWEVTVLPTNPRYFDDLSCLPSLGKVGEPIPFAVRVRDTFGNPCPGKTISVYRRENGTPVKVLSVSTDGEGKALFSLVPEKEGVFAVEAWVYQANLSLTWSIPINP